MVDFTIDNEGFSLLDEVEYNLQKSKQCMSMAWDHYKTADWVGSLGQAFYALNNGMKANLLRLGIEPISRRGMLIAFTKEFVSKKYTSRRVGELFLKTYYYFNKGAVDMDSSQIQVLLSDVEGLVETLFCLGVEG